MNAIRATRREKTSCLLMGACLTPLLLLGAAGTSSAQSSPAKAGLDPARLATMRGELEKLVAAKQIAGAVTVIARNGKIGSLEAIGQRDIEARAPMRPDTIFRIASMTKVATAVAVLMLEDQGKLSVDEPVEKHLPEFRGQKLIEKQNGASMTLTDPPRPITIKDLLTHTSGMRCQPPPGFADLGSKKNRTLAEAVVAFSQQPLESPPGKTWRYCGTAFGTLGRVIEVASGTSFEKFLSERLFRPLGMRDTAFRLTSAQRARLAAAYTKSSDAPGAPVVRSENQGPAKDQPVVYTDPGGGLYSTAQDFTRLMQLLLDKGSVRGRRLLRPETVVKLTGVHFTSKEKVGFTPGLGMGLGVQVVMTPTGVTESLSPGSFGHGGAHGTQAWADPVSGAIYILMIQRQGFGNGDMSDVRQTFQRLGSAALVKPAPLKGS